MQEGHNQKGNHHWEDTDLSFQSNMSKKRMLNISWTSMPWKSHMVTQLVPQDDGTELEENFL